MKEHPVRRERLQPQSERVILKGYFQKRRSFFALFLISCAILIAAFAITFVWTGTGNGWKGGGAVTEESGTGQTEETDSAASDTCPDADETDSMPDDPEAETEPTGGTPIRSKDLSPGEGAHINNESIRIPPPLSVLLEADVSSKVSEGPLVLVLHTHASEGYSTDGSIWIEGDIGEVTYTENEEQNVIGVGRVLCDTLRANGIGAIHCTTAHDRGGIRGAYSASMESIRFFLSLYPSIRYVIDLHRDAILTDRGEYVRAVTETADGDCAQVMAVVGSDGNGTACENWEGNLALALQLQRVLNGDGRAVSRTVTLRNASYNQEAAPFSLLLEIGTGANSAEEAKRAAVLVGNALACLILGK